MAGKRVEVKTEYKHNALAFYANQKQEDIKNSHTGSEHPVVLYYKIHNICSYSQTQLSVMSLTFRNLASYI